MEDKRNYRPRGTGHVFARGNRWYGEFYVRGKKTERSLGPVRQPGSRQGLLTKAMAEQRLRDLTSDHAKAPPPVIDGRMTIAEVGARRVASLARKGRRPDAHFRTTRPTSDCTSRRSSATRRWIGSRPTMSRSSSTRAWTTSSARRVISGH